MADAVVEALFRDVSLTRQALHSYDDFVSRVVPEVVETHRPIDVVSDFNMSGPRHVIQLKSPRFDIPSCVEKNNDIRRTTPMEARVRDLMYSAPMYVDVHYIHTNPNGARVTDVARDVYLARMPVMVRSSLCVLNGKDDYAKTECPNDPGGYFIVNGREKTLVVQERISPNMIFCFSPNECLYHAEYDQVSHKVSTLRIKVRKFGSTPFRVTMLGLDVDVPILILLRALGATDDVWQAAEPIRRRRLGRRNNRGRTKVAGTTL